MKEPQPYFFSEMHFERMEAATLYIQRKLRGWFARKLTNQLKQQKASLQRIKLEEEESYRKQEELNHRREIERRTHPRSKEDFQILYEELEVSTASDLLYLIDLEDQRDLKG